MKWLHALLWLVSWRYREYCLGEFVVTRQFVDLFVANTKELRDLQTSKRKGVIM